MNENIALSTRYPTAAGWDLLHKLENLGGNKDSLSDYTNGLFMVYYVIHWNEKIFLSGILQEIMLQKICTKYEWLL